MTPTSSFKTNLKNALAVFKWELKNSRTLLIVYSVLAAAFAAMVLTLCMVVSVDVKALDAAKIQNAVLVFQLVTSYGVFFLTMVFTIIYTAGSYSYLHNKRKIDMYGSLPIGSSTLFLSKTLAAFLFSVVPALFFFGIIAVLSLCFGQPLVNETVSLYAKVLIGTIACIAFYGLLAICCGTTGYAVVSFIAVCFAYPIAARFVRALIRAFFLGLPVEAGGNSFLMNALNPLDAYGGEHVVYWLLFSNACLLLSSVLCQKRRSERAQNSFAYFIPAHMVKLIVSFIAGMLLGTLFGSLNAFGNGLLGFAFGFLLGAAPACVIVHVIYYKSFARFWWASVPFAVMVLVTFAAVGFCSADVFGYNARVPAAAEVASAGYVDLGDYYTFGQKGVRDVSADAADDFTDEKSIENVIAVHNSVLEDAEFTSQKKLAKVWATLLTDDFEQYMRDGGSFCVGYKLKNGGTVLRYYRSIWLNRYVIDSKASGALRETEAYKRNYLNAANVSPGHIASFSILGELNQSRYIAVKPNSEVSDSKAKQDQLTLLEAIRRDGILSDENRTDGDLKLRLSMEYTTAEYSENVQQLISLIDGQNEESAVFSVCSDDVNTLSALKNIGVITDDGKINPDSPYCIQVIKD